MAWGVIVGPVGFRHDAHILRLYAHGNDLTVDFIADFLEGSDGSHVKSHLLFRARDHRSLDGDQMTGGTIGLHRVRP